MKEYAKEFYKGTAWKKCRETYLKSVGGLCELCLKQGVIKPAEEVHHIKHIDEKTVNDPNVTLAHSNLIALCREHHRQQHSNRAKHTRYTIDEYGHVTPKPQHAPR